jgi:hypothetical protein
MGRDGRVYMQSWAIMRCHLPYTSSTRWQHQIPAELCAMCRYTIYQVSGYSTDTPPTSASAASSGNNMQYQVLAPPMAVAAVAAARRPWIRCSPLLLSARAAPRTQFAALTPSC